MSGNPFRRNAPTKVNLQPAEEERAERAPSPFKVGKKKKKVKIQTPPHSPEEIPRRLSAGRVSPPPPDKTSSDDDDDDDAGDSTATADSDIEQAQRNTRRNSGSLPPPGQVQTPSAAPSPATTPGTGGSAPQNPFARTLATGDAAFGLQRSKEGEPDGLQARAERGGKKGMDVDMFKNILMTGSPAPTPPQQRREQPHEQSQGTHPQDSSSGTDASSGSKTSLFDQNYNIHPESPRSSFDHADYSDQDDADDERGGLMGANKERLDDYGPPAPPKPGLAPKAAKGPQTVSFADFDDFSPTDGRSLSPATAAAGGKHRPPSLHRSASDLNKPLPRTPPLSPGPPQEKVGPSIDEQAQQAPQPPKPAVTAPEESAKKAPPPPPPTSRRAGQTGTPQTRARSTSNTTEDMAAEAVSSPPEPQDAQPKSAAPPLPPSRKSKPASHVPSPAASTPASEAPPAASPAPAEPESKSMQPPPAPAPRRNPSTKPGSAMHRTPSNASHHSTLSHTNTAPPPAPPPRRAAGSKRESLDGDGRRRSSQNSLESARSGSVSKPPAESEEAKAGESDILADMTAFQAEIDALRKQAGTGQ